MHQQQIVQNSNYKTQHYRSRIYSQSSLLSHITFNLTDQQKRRQLLNNLIKSQRQIIYNLRFINNVLRQEFRLHLKLQEQLQKKIFDEYSRLLGMHLSFQNKISKMVEQGPFSNEQVVQVLRYHLDIRVVYADYFQNLRQIRQEINNIYIENVEIIDKLYKNMQPNIDYYLIFPALHLPIYQKFIELYLKSLQQDPQQSTQPVVTKLSKLYTDYKNQLKNIPTKQQLDKQLVQIKNQIFTQHLPGFHQYQILYSASIFVCQQNQELTMYLIKVTKFNSFNNNNLLEKVNYQKIYMLVEKKQTDKIIKSFVIEIGKEFCYVRFQDMINQKNRVGLADADNFYMIKFYTESSLNNFEQIYKSNLNFTRQKIKQKQQIFSYEAQTYQLPLTFQIVGVYQRLFCPQKYIIKITLHSYNIHQFIFITESQLNSLFSHYQKNKILKIQYKNQIFIHVKGINSSQNYLKQHKIIEIQTKLNNIVRNKNMRSHCQYFFSKLCIQEGIWELIQRDRKVQGKCKCKSKKNTFIFQKQQIQELFKKLQQFNENDQYKNKEFSHHIMKAYNQLTKKLRNNINSMNSFYNYSQKLKQKLYLAFLEQRMINWKLCKLFNKLPKEKILTIKHYSLPVFSSRNSHIHPQLNILYQYTEQTIQILQRKACNQLKLKVFKDFGMCRFVGQQINYYDNHQYIKDVNKSSAQGYLWLSKKWFFHENVQFCLLNEEDKQLRMRLVIGQIIQKLRKSTHIVNSPNQPNQILEQFLRFFFIFVIKLSIISYEQINYEILSKILPNNILKNPSQKITEQRFQLIKKFLLIQIVQNDITKIYEKLINLAHKLQLTNTIYKSQFLKNEKNQKQQNQTVQLNVNYKILKIGHIICLQHDDYKIHVVGNLLCIICIKRNNTQSKQSKYWLKFSQAWTAYRQIVIYQKIYERNQNIKTSFEECTIQNIYNDFENKESRCNYQTMIPTQFYKYNFEKQPIRKMMEEQY